jgi:hypothetical protein
MDTAPLSNNSVMCLGHFGALYLSLSLKSWALHKYKDRGVSRCAYIHGSVTGVGPRAYRYWKKVGPVKHCELT